LNFFPVDCILLFKHPWIKKTSNAYAKMAGSLSKPTRSYQTTHNRPRS